MESGGKRQGRGSAEGLTRRSFVEAGMLAAGALIGGSGLARAGNEDSREAVRKTRSYHPDMEYRQLGKTGLWVSAVGLGGHWKRVKVMNQDLVKNRRKVVRRCMEVGINYVDACCAAEVRTYSKALGGHRDEVFLALSHCGQEVRNEKYRTADKLMESLDALLMDADLDYTDLWRITCLEPGGRHSFNTACEMVKALEKAKKQGKARFIGISSHDRRWLKMMVEQFPEIEVILFPYTARSRVLTRRSVSNPASDDREAVGARLDRDPRWNWPDESSLFDLVQKRNVGTFGIKPFASNALFRGTGAPDDPHAEEDDRRARLAIRYILCNPAITAPIPGLINSRQVENVARAVRERRRLDVAEAEELDGIMDEAWAKLPQGYEWLKNWQYV